MTLMAEKALKKVEDQLSCSICLDAYTNPKQLQCFHVYCQKCLVKVVAKDRQQGGKRTDLTCPTCRKVTPIPANGVAGLQSAFQINHLLDIVNEHKKETEQSLDSETLYAESLDSVGSTATASLTQSLKVTTSVAGCSEHGGKELEMYCETCGELICLKCATKAGKHHNHDYAELSKAFEIYKGETTRLMEPLGEKLSTINKALEQIESCCEEVSNQWSTVEADINSSFKQLQTVMEDRRATLISQLCQTTNSKLRCLAAQRDQMEATEAQLSGCLEAMKESIETSSQEEALVGKTKLVRKVKELTTAYQPDMLKPNTEPDILFSASADVTAVFQKYGQISARDPSKFHRDETATVVGETYTASLHISESQQCEESTKSIECELVSEITGARAIAKVERKEQSRYEISYQPTMKGRQQLNIKVNCEHIRGSPFGVVAVGKSPVEKLGTPIQTLRGVRTAEGVALNQRGEVVVTEWNGHCVHVFSCNGRKLRSFGSHGSSWGQFKNPRAVAVDGSGNILVADCHNHRIQKFTEGGQFLAAVGVKGNGPLQFNNCDAITLSRSNNKLYVVERNERVQILNSDLTFCSEFGRRGNGRGQFDEPSGIACDSSGNVYVAEQKNHRIQVFNAEGNFLRMFGTRGSGRGQLDHPGSVAVDADGLVYVSEYANHRISVFTSMGRFVTSFGRWGEGPGEFKRPRGIAVDACGIVYVSDWGNGCVKLF